MKNVIYLFLLISVLNSSCKKTEMSRDNLDQTAGYKKNDLSKSNGTVLNLTDPNCEKHDLIPLGNGVYQYPSFNGVTIRVSNIWYKTTDDYGQPMPLRDGDPVYGTIEVALSGGSEFVEMQSNEYPQNHFVIKQGVISGGNGSINYTGYSNDYNTALNSYTNAYSNWLQLYQISQQQNTQPPVPPQFNPPFFSDYITQVITAGWRTITGKIIRSTTGSTFALACENYPVPPPPPPPPPCAICIYCQTHPNDPTCP